MNEFLASGQNWEHILAAVLLLARLGDIGSTYLVTPTLRLEANSVARKFGWPFALLTTLVCLLPYYNTALAMVAIVVSFLATAGNLSRGWVVRALGEAEYLRILQRAAAASAPATAIGFIVASAGTFALVGLGLLLVSGGPEAWPFWFAVGLITYAFTVATHGCSFVRRLYRNDVRRSESPAVLPASD
jgi:hypothetical protein